MPSLVNTLFSSGSSGLTVASGSGDWFPLTATEEANFIIRGNQDLTGSGSDTLTLWLETSNDNNPSIDPKNVKPIYLRNPADDTISTTLATIAGNTTRSSDPKTPSVLQGYKIPNEGSVPIDRYVRVSFSTSGGAAISNFKGISVDIAYNIST